MNVLMLYPKFPAETFWNTSRSVQLLWGRKAIMPPLGLLTIASYLPDDFSLRLIDRNVAEETEADWAWADVVFLSLMLAQREDYRLCVAAARARGKPIAVGGPFTHALPEAAAADADWVCFGEAENIMDEFAADLRAGRRGRHYQGGAETDMEAVRPPRFDLVPDLNAYVTMDVQFSRGCPFRCEFCDIIEIYGRVPRAKTPRQVTAELAALKRLGFRGYVFLVDDNFIGNKRKAKALLEELAAWNRAEGYPFRYYTEASINLADDDELVGRMADAGFFHVFIGIETPDPKLLKTTQKMQNVPGNPLEKLARLRARGIHVTAGFIVGFDGEERGVFEAQRRFVQASGIGVAMVGLLQAIPHTQLARRLRAEGRLLELDLGGVSTMEGINFIPKGALTKREYLERYAALVGAVYAPEAYFARSLPALLALRTKIPLRALRRNARELAAVLVKEIYHFGIKNKAMRPYFWKVFLRLLWKNPAALEAFAFDSSVFAHLNRHAGYVRRELGRYLAAPAPGDVLDRALPDAPPPARPGKIVRPAA
ncbi:MAG TPA: radical SAM protein [Candidatus Binatia bacterium]